jgi:hypothetical protein
MAKCIVQHARSYEGAKKQSEKGAVIQALSVGQSNPVLPSLMFKQQRTYTLVPRYPKRIPGSLYRTAPRHLSLIPVSPLPLRARGDAGIR